MCGHVIHIIDKSMAPPTLLYAELAELAYAHDSKSCGFTMRVRLPHSAPSLISYYNRRLY